jgi:hypothetical protein
MSEEETTRHRFEAWFGLPVCVQLRTPYVVPRDEGSVEIEVQGDSTDKIETRSYGTPFVRADQSEPGKTENVILVAVTGQLFPDGDGVMLVADMKETGPHARLDATPPTLGQETRSYKIRVALDPRDIAYITVISEPLAEPSAILAP